MDEIAMEKPKHISRNGTCTTPFIEEEGEKKENLATMLIMKSICI
jgi:hypothetical protein